MATGDVQEVVPPVLNSTSEPPPLFDGTTRIVHEVLPPVLDTNSAPPPMFDGTTRLYTSYRCPYAQRVWIVRNYKGLQDEIKMVGLDLVNRPAWYKEKVYPANKVPALEHNNEIRGESINLMKYIDRHFKGPALLPEDPIKREFAEELLSYTDTFTTVVMAALKQNANADPTFDHLETAITKFDDGPFFLGQFSLVDIAYIPFFQRYARLLLDVKNYDITIGRPKLTLWLEEMEKVEAYTQTRVDHEEIIAILKMRLLKTS